MNPSTVLKPIYVIYLHRFELELSAYNLRTQSLGDSFQSAVPEFTS